MSNVVVCNNCPDSTCSIWPGCTSLEYVRLVIFSVRFFTLSDFNPVKKPVSLDRHNAFGINVVDWVPRLIRVVN